MMTWVCKSLRAWVSESNPRHVNIPCHDPDPCTDAAGACGFSGLAGGGPDGCADMAGGCLFVCSISFVICAAILGSIGICGGPLLLGSTAGGNTGVGRVCPAPGSCFIVTSTEVDGPAAGVGSGGFAPPVALALGPAGG